jgi:hypothetical protein
MPMQFVFDRAGANVARCGQFEVHAIAHVMGDAKCTTLLLAAGADVHARDEFGKNAVHCKRLRSSASTTCCHVEIDCECDARGWC